MINYDSIKYGCIHPGQVRTNNINGKTTTIIPIFYVNGDSESILRIKLPWMVTNGMKKHRQGVMSLNAHFDSEVKDDVGKFIHTPEYGEEYGVAYMLEERLVAIVSDVMKIGPLEAKTAFSGILQYRYGMNGKLLGKQKPSRWFAMNNRTAHRDGSTFYLPRKGLDGKFVRVEWELLERGHATIIPVVVLKHLCIQDGKITLNTVLESAMVVAYKPPEVVETDYLDMMAADVDAVGAVSLEGFLA